MTRSKTFTFAIAAAILAGVGTLAIGDARERYMAWKVHDMDRPQPPVVEPGHPGTQDAAGKAPSDAIVLFDGSDTDAFHNGKNQPVGWTINDDGAFVRTPRKGNAYTKQAFGDIQLHVEWLIPESQAKRTGQRRGNSGIFLMNHYEIQVLDNKNNPTYPDGMAGSLYGQFPPLVNPGRGIERWQTYDIIFRRPHFNEDGSVKKPATITVLHNGVLVQDHQEILGPTEHKRRTQYRKHADKLPIRIQNHGEEAHFRNIWVRELAPRDD